MKKAKYYFSNNDEIIDCFVLIENHPCSLLYLPKLAKYECSCLVLASLDAYNIYRKLSIHSYCNIDDKRVLSKLVKDLTQLLNEYKRFR